MPQASFSLQTTRTSTDAFFLIIIMPDKCTTTTITAYYPRGNIPREDIILITHMETGSERLNSLGDGKWEEMTSEYPAVFSTLCRLSVCKTETGAEVYSPSAKSKGEEKMKQNKLSSYSPNCNQLYTVVFIHDSMEAVKTAITSHFPVIMSRDPPSSDTTPYRTSILGRPQSHYKERLSSFVQNSTSWWDLLVPLDDCVLSRKHAQCIFFVSQKRHPEEPGF